MYSTTLDHQHWVFPDLQTVLAKATPPRSGDRLAALSAGSTEERVAARYCLADIPLKTFLEEAIVPYEIDEVTRLILDGHDAAPRNPFTINPT